MLLQEMKYGKTVVSLKERELGLRKSVICFSFFFFSFAVLAACSSLPVVTPTAQLTDITHTNLATKYLTPTPVITVSPTATKTQVISTPTPMAPDIQIIAPENREVDLADLGLSDTTRLILYYQPSNSLRIMSGKDIQPQKIPNIDSEAMFSRVNLKHISPDHKWFIYYTFREVIDKVVYYDYWISSIDGKNQWIIFPRVESRTHTEWITNDQIELWYRPSRYDCPKRVAVLNPFSGKTLAPPEIPPSTMPHCIFSLSTNPDHTKLIYRNDITGTWNIFDFKNGKNQTVFPWLSSSDAYHLWPRYVRWLPSGITYVLPKQESIEFAVDLSPSSAADINSQWNRILLPSSNKILDNWFSWWSLGDGLLGFDIVGPDTDLIANRRESLPSKFVIFDLRHSILYDYNLDRAKTGNRQKVSDKFISASADNRFLAWTIYEPPDISHPSETVVLERATGRIARIKGFEFFGWGEIDEP
jgi:hypothetical protein